MLDKLRFTLIFTLVLSLLLTSLAFAIPRKMNYQGKVTDAAGTPLDGTYDMKFRIYNGSDDGNLLWGGPDGEEHSVLVTDGVFAVSLGAVMPLFEGVFTSTSQYLDVEIYNPVSSTWETLSPRQRLTSTAYAFRAADAESLEGQNASEFALKSHLHGWGDITGIPSGFADGTDDTGITSETDPTITDNSIKDGVSWGEIQAIPSGFADGVDNTGITRETDPQVGTINEGYMPYWTGGVLTTGGIYGSKSIGGPPDYDNYWKLGIGTTNPAHMLTVETDGDSDIAVYGKNSLYGHYGKLGTSTYGAIGSNANGNYGILGWSGYGVFAYNASSNTGMLAGPNEGALGMHSSGNYGQLGMSKYGAYGKHNISNNWGALGTETVGVEGRTTSTNEWHNAIYGKNEGAGSGVYGWSQNRFGTVGVTASTDPNEAGVWAVNNGAGPGLIAKAGTDGYAAIFDGNVLIRSVIDGSKVVEIGEGLDYAEGFHVTGKSDILAGSVLVIDPVNSGKLMLSQKPYDTKVAGIVAGAKSLGSGVRLGAGQFDHDVALAGRVYCNVDANYGEVEPGDLLTTAPKAGYAMKVGDYSRAQGAILGKAMQGLAKGEKGQILVLVTLQ